MHWHVAEAKRKFSEILRATATEPQLIFNRDRLVAAMIDAQIYEAFQVWYEQQHCSTLATAFAALRQLCTEEGDTLSAPARQDRTNAFAEVLDDASLWYEYPDRTGTSDAERWCTHLGGNRTGDSPQCGHS